MAAKRRIAPASDPGQSSGRKRVRTFTDWTYSRIRAAELMADGGRLDEAVRVCDWLLAYPAVANALDTRRDAILGLTPTFEPSGDKRRSNKAVKALEAGEDFWAGYPETELGQLIQWRLLLGVGIGRHDWTDPDPDHGGRILPGLEFWHPTGLRYDFDLAKWFGKDHREQGFEITPGDGIHVVHSLAKFHPWMLGAWRRLSRVVLLAHLATTDWSKHSEKGATLVATSDAQSTGPQRKQLLTDLQNADEDMIVVLQAGFDLKLLELTANTEQIYKAQIDMANKVCSILLLGGNLSTDVGANGAKSATETQVKSGQVPRLRSDAEALTTTVHDQSLTWWAEFNYGDPGLAPWPVYPTEPEEDKKAKAETIKTLADGVEKLDKMGFEIDVDAMTEEFGIDWITGRTKPEPPPAPLIAPVPDDQPPAPAPDKKASAKRTLRNGAIVALASGALAAENKGFINGQLYVDALTESSLETGKKALQPTLDAILEELDAATGYDDLRNRLNARYADLDPSELSDLVYRAMAVADLAGRAAVNEDA